jgi:hypothetical protein
MLVVRFTLPVRNDKGMEDIMGPFTDLISTAIADKFVHGTTFTDNVFKSIDEFLGTMMHGKDINDMGVMADEYLGAGVTVDSGDLGHNSVCSNWFMASKNVEHGKW